MVKNKFFKNIVLIFLPLIIFSNVNTMQNCRENLLLIEGLKYANSIKLSEVIKYLQIRHEWWNCFIPETPSPVLKIDNNNSSGFWNSNPFLVSMNNKLNRLTVRKDHYAALLSPLKKIIKLNKIVADRWFFIEEKLSEKNIKSEYSLAQLSNKIVQELEAISADYALGYSFLFNDEEDEENGKTSLILHDLNKCIKKLNAGVEACWAKWINSSQCKSLKPINNAYPMARTMEEWHKDFNAVNELNSAYMNRIANIVSVKKLNEDSSKYPDLTCIEKNFYVIDNIRTPIAEEISTLQSLILQLKKDEELSEDDALLLQTMNFFKYPYISLEKYLKRIATEAFDINISQHDEFDGVQSISRESSGDNKSCEVLEELSNEFSFKAMLKNENDLVYLLFKNDVSIKDARKIRNQIIKNKKTKDMFHEIDIKKCDLLLGTSDLFQAVLCAVKFAVLGVKCSQTNENLETLTKVLHFLNSCDQETSMRMQYLLDISLSDFKSCIDSKINDLHEKMFIVKPQTTSTPSSAVPEVKSNTAVAIVSNSVEVGKLIKSDETSPSYVPTCESSISVASTSSNSSTVGLLLKKTTKKNKRLKLNCKQQQNKRRLDREKLCGVINNQLFKLLTFFEIINNVVKNTCGHDSEAKNKVNAQLNDYFTMLSNVIRALISGIIEPGAYNKNGLIGFWVESNQTITNKIYEANEVTLVGNINSALNELREFIVKKFVDSNFSKKEMQSYAIDGCITACEKNLESVQAIQGAHKDIEICFITLFLTMFKYTDSETGSESVLSESSIPSGSHRQAMNDDCKRIMEEWGSCYSAINLYLNNARQIQLFEALSEVKAPFNSIDGDKEHDLLQKEFVIKFITFRTNTMGFLSNLSNNLSELCNAIQNGNDSVRIAEVCMRDIELLLAQKFPFEKTLDPNSELVAVDSASAGSKYESMLMAYKEQSKNLFTNIYLISLIFSRFLKNAYGIDYDQYVLKSSIKCLFKSLSYYVVSISNIILEEDYNRATKIYQSIQARLESFLWDRQIKKIDSEDFKTDFLLLLQLILKFKIAIDVSIMRQVASGVSCENRVYVDVFINLINTVMNYQKEFETSTISFMLKGKLVLGSHDYEQGLREKYWELIYFKIMSCIELIKKNYMSHVSYLKDSLDNSNNLQFAQGCVEKNIVGLDNVLNNIANLNNESKNSEANTQLKRSRIIDIQRSVQHFFKTELKIADHEQPFISDLITMNDQFANCDVSKVFKTEESHNDFYNCYAEVKNWIWFMKGLVGNESINIVLNQIPN